MDTIPDTSIQTQLLHLKAQKTSQTRGRKVIEPENMEACCEIVSPGNDREMIPSIPQKIWLSNRDLNNDNINRGVNSAGSHLIGSHP